MFYINCLNFVLKCKLKTNKSVLCEIKINDVALVLGTCSQIATHCLCGRDAAGVRQPLTPCDVGIFMSTRRH